jgi:hypothetical protein
LGLAQVVEGMNILFPTQDQFLQITCSVFNEYIVVSAFSPEKSQKFTPPFFSFL